MCNSHTKVFVAIPWCTGYTVVLLIYCSTVHYIHACFTVVCCVSAIVVRGRSLLVRTVWYEVPYDIAYVAVRFVCVSCVVVHCVLACALVY